MGEECNTKVTEGCRNVTTGEVECQNIEKFVCVDSITNKCGIEAVLKNVSYTETVCRNKLKTIRLFPMRSANTSWRKYPRKSVRRSRKWSVMKRRIPLKKQKRNLQILLMITRIIL